MRLERHIFVWINLTRLEIHNKRVRLNENKIQEIILKVTKRITTLTATKRIALIAATSGIANKINSPKVKSQKFSLKRV